MDVSIVLPVYRNADALEELHRRLCAVMQKEDLSFEIVFVDDRSPDRSLELLKTLRPATVIANAFNLGQHRSVLCGIGRASGGIVVVMDADLQDEPETIPLLLRRLERGDVHCVFAGRRGLYEAWHRQVTSLLFHSLIRLITGVPRGAGMFFAADRLMVSRLLAYRDPDPFVVAMIGCTGLRVTAIPVQRRARPFGRSSYSSWSRLSIGIRAIKMIYRLKFRI